jgi:hypothetical protein
MTGASVVSTYVPGTGLLPDLVAMLMGNGPQVRQDLLQAVVSTYVRTGYWLAAGSCRHAHGKWTAGPQVRQDLLQAARERPSAFQ